MAGSRAEEMDDMGVEDLEELVREHERAQPSEEERRAFRNFHTEIREELIGKTCVCRVRKGYPAPVTVLYSRFFKILTSVCLCRTVRIWHPEGWYSAADIEVWAGSLLAAYRLAGR